MDWESIKQQARLAYARAAQLLVFLQVVFYLFACIVAMKPLGPKDYVGFTYHVVQWSPGKAWLGSPGVYARERAR